MDPLFVLAAVGGGLLLGAGYALACLVWPFSRCARCDGTGHRTTWLLERLVPCRWCYGSGRRLRAGRRAYNLVHARRPR